MDDVDCQRVQDDIHDVGHNRSRAFKVPSPSGCVVAVTLLLRLPIDFIVLVNVFQSWWFPFVLLLIVGGWKSTPSSVKFRNEVPVDWRRWIEYQLERTTTTGKNKMASVLCMPPGDFPFRVLIQCLLLVLLLPFPTLRLSLLYPMLVLFIKCVEELGNFTLRLWLWLSCAKTRSFSDWRMSFDRKC